MYCYGRLFCSNFRTIAVQSNRFRRPFRRHTIKTLTEDEHAKLLERKKGLNSSITSSSSKLPETDKWNTWSLQKTSGANHQKRLKLIGEGKFVLPEHIIYQQLRKGDNNLR